MAPGGASFEKQRVSSALARTRAAGHQLLAASRARVPDRARRMGGWLRSDEFLTTSSSLAFYAMISLPPMVLIALWAVGAVVPGSALEDLGGQVEESAPQQLPIGAVVRSLIELAAEAGALSVLAAVWPATTYGAALGRAFENVAPRSPDELPGWKGRLLALLLIAALPVVVFGGLAVLYVVPRLVGGQAWQLTAALALGTVLALGALIALVFQLYAVRETSASDVLTGAAVTTALIAAVSGLYLLYLEVGADFDQRYGATSLATAVLLGVWLLLTHAMLLVGYRTMLRRAQRRHGHLGAGAAVQDPPGRAA